MAFTILMRSLCLVMIPVTSNVPSAMALYWTASAAGVINVSLFPPFNLVFFWRSFQQKDSHNLVNPYLRKSTTVNCICQLVRDFDRIRDMRQNKICRSILTIFYSYQRILYLAVTASFMKSLDLWLNHQTTDTILTDFQCNLTNILIYSSAQGQGPSLKFT